MKGLIMKKFYSLNEIKIGQIIHGKHSIPEWKVIELCGKENGYYVVKAKLIKIV
jgi:hypothetical protein